MLGRTRSALRVALKFLSANRNLASLDPATQPDRRPERAAAKSRSDRAVSSSRCPLPRRGRAVIRREGLLMAAKPVKMPVLVPALPGRRLARKWSGYHVIPGPAAMRCQFSYEVQRICDIFADYTTLVFRTAFHPLKPSLHRPTCR